MDELEREVKIYGEVDRIIHKLNDLKATYTAENLKPIQEAINVLHIMREELRRSDLEIKDLKAGG